MGKVGAAAKGARAAAKGAARGAKKAPGKAKSRAQYSHKMNQATKTPVRGTGGIARAVGGVKARGKSVADKTGPTRRRVAAGPLGRRTTVGGAAGAGGFAAGNKKKGRGKRR